MGKEPEKGIGTRQGLGTAIFIARTTPLLPPPVGETKGFPPQGRADGQRGMRGQTCCSSWRWNAPATWQAIGIQGQPEGMAEKWRQWSKRAHRQPRGEAEER